MKRTTIQNVSAVQNVEDVKKVLMNIIQVLNTARATENKNTESAGTALSTAQGASEEVDTLSTSVDALTTALSDHIAGDDHTIYLRTDGTRASTGVQNFLQGLKALLTSDVVGLQVQASIAQSLNLSEWYTGFLGLVTWIDSQAVLKTTTVPSTLDDVTNKKYVDGQISSHNHNSLYIRLDGTSAPTADISLNSKKLTNVANPVNLQDAATAFWTISNFALLAQNLNDLPSKPTARANLGLGNSATLNVGTTAGTVAAGDHSHQSIFPIWAEESGSISPSVSSGYQWSFGNGATGTNTRLTIAFNCTLVKVSLRATGSTPNATVEVYKNGAATGAAVVLSSGNNAVTVLGSPVSFSSGDDIMFRTTAFSGSGGGPNVVTAWFEVTI